MLTEGMFVGDRYEIVNKIGTGGMSDVYKAKDHTLGRFVAIKVLKPEFSEDVNFADRTEHVGICLCQIDHRLRAS